MQGLGSLTLEIRRTKFPLKKNALKTETTHYENAAHREIFGRSFFRDDAHGVVETKHIATRKGAM